MFEFLFKYSPVVYQEGQWAFRFLPPAVWIAAALIATVALFALVYARSVTPVSGWFRGFLALLKTAAILLLLLCIAEPFVSVTTVVPKKGTVVVLLDDSASMSIRESKAGAARKENVADWYYGADDQAVRAALDENFHVLTYRFGRNVSAIEGPGRLTAADEASDLVSALQFVEKQSQTYPVSAVIVAGDGVHIPAGGVKASESEDPLQSAAVLKNLGIPIYTVGTGSRITNDVQLTRVSASRSVLENDFIEMSALVHSRGAEGQKVTVELLEEGRRVQSREIALNGKYTRVSFSHRPGRKGNLKYTARVVPTPDEIIEINNEKHFLVNNEERLGRILYVEELHPWDYKFIRRAIDLDKSLQLVSLLRTGPEKYYRQGIMSGNELAGGFPKERGELFSFHAIVIGSIESSFLTEDQQNLLREFVSVRGGGLLMLGGPKSFSQGGWERSRLAEILPVELLGENEASREIASPMRRAPFKLQLTPEGLRSPLLQLANEPQQNRLQWQDMPELLGYNPVGSARPGATVLAVHPLSQPGREKIIAAEQRYGRGRTMALATSSSWRWQMQMPSEDMSHERLWRQIGRWLALSAPEPVEIIIDKDNYGLGDRIEFKINALDSSFSAVNNAQISVQLTLPYDNAGKTGADQGDPPVGSVRTLDVVPSLTKKGYYTTEYTPAMEGLYDVQVMAHDSRGRYLGSATRAFYASREYVEFARPDVNEPLLRRIAEISDGKYFALKDAGDIADELVVAKSSYSKTVERDLWDSPAIFLAVLLLLGLEWFIRRAKGMS